jgi:hypothetical protein
VKTPAPSLPYWLHRRECQLVPTYMLARPYWRSLLATSILFTQVRGTGILGSTPRTLSSRIRYLAGTCPPHSRSRMSSLHERAGMMPTPRKGVQGKGNRGGLWEDRDGVTEVRPRGARLRPLLPHDGGLRAPRARRLLGGSVARRARELG